MIPLYTKQPCKKVRGDCLTIPSAFSLLSLIIFGNDKIKLKIKTLQV